MMTHLFEHLLYYNKDFTRFFTFKTTSDNKQEISVRNYKTLSVFLPELDQVSLKLPLQPLEPPSKPTRVRVSLELSLISR